MRLEYFSSVPLSKPAEDLVQFDIDSIRMTVSSEPDVWLVDPALYESNGRIFRDSPTPRLLAYSRADKTVYASDGCNACTKRLNVALENLTDSELQEFAEDNSLPPALLDRLAELL